MPNLEDIIHDAQLDIDDIECRMELYSAPADYERVLRRLVERLSEYMSDLEIERREGEK